MVSSFFSLSYLCFNFWFLFLIRKACIHDQVAASYPCLYVTASLFFPYLVLTTLPVSFKWCSLILPCLILLSSLLSLLVFPISCTLKFAKFFVFMLCCKARYGWFYLLSLFICLFVFETMWRDSNLGCCHYPMDLEASHRFLWELNELIYGKVKIADYPLVERL